jgi:uncharacterized protein (TIGR00369 family)
MKAHETGLTLAELEVFLCEEFPQVADLFRVVEAAPREVVLERAAGEADLRPGGTVSGPTLFGLADVAVYLAIMATIGRVPLAVTTNCAIDFLRKPAPGPIRCRARLWKVGRVLVVGEAHVFTPGDEDRPVARAQLTYSIPPK